MFKNKFKYNAIVRKKIKGRWHYYVQQTWEGVPPERFKSLTQTAVGIDIGTSTVATSSHYQTELRELAQGVDTYQNEIRRLQRKLDRKRRSNNPENYNENGTIKKGRKVWHDSKSYVKTRDRLANIKRKQRETRDLAHKQLANEIVNMGDSFVVEKMSFKGLQAKTKETTINEKTGRYTKKKRFGKTIAHRAPAKLIEILKYKAAFQSKPFIVANTNKIKASQLDHSTEEYTKSSLADRTKIVDNQLVQRDLYSAFLLQHVNIDGETIDLDACKQDFEMFLRNQDETMRTLNTKLTSTGRTKFAQNT